MVETYDSVLDRIGAFNAATERFSKGRGSDMEFSVGGRPELRLRLARTADSYAIQVIGAPASASEALAGMGLLPDGDLYAREVRRSERSWTVASELEDILQDALGLGPAIAISAEID